MIPELLFGDRGTFISSTSFVGYDVSPLIIFTTCFLEIRVDKTKFVAGIIWELIRGPYGITLSQNPCVYTGLPSGPKEYKPRFIKQALEDYKPGISRVTVLMDRLHPVELQLKVPSITLGNVWKVANMFVVKGACNMSIDFLKIHGQSSEMDGTLMTDKRFLERNSLSFQTQNHNLSFSDGDAFVESLSAVSERPDLPWLIRKEPVSADGVRSNHPTRPWQSLFTIIIFRDPQ
jgi:hypothetical protein